VFLTYAHKLLETGVRVFAYQPTVMHAKTIVIDNRWSTIGSTNMDILSFFFNREANLVTRNTEMAKALTAQFEMDLKDSEEIHLETLAKRPWYIKILGYGGRALQFILIKGQRTA
jgi:cardiolipin synthase